MKVIAEKNEKLDTVLASLSSVVEGKYFYLPGWFEKLPDDSFQFHHMNNLPKELVDIVEKTREEQPKKSK